MMKNEGSSNSGKRGGLGFCSILTLIFITLKLLGKINWSWAWVLSPLWIVVSLGVLIFAIVLVSQLSTS